MYKETVDASLWAPEQNDVLDTQQRDEDEGGSHRFHVGRGFGAVGLLQLRDEDADDVQEEEEVHLCKIRGINSKQPQVC